MTFSLKRIHFLFFIFILNFPVIASSKPLENNNKSEVYFIEEVRVTAQRRSQNLQSVPVSVSSFSQSNLQEMQISDLGDLQNAVPNLTLHVGDASNSVVYIRGVGQIDSLAFADPGVGIYLDDVYLGRSQGSFLEVFDVERIEVLRGPQGTLYGRNTIGGAVKFISSVPTQEFTSEIQSTLGNYNRQGIKAIISAPLIDDKLLGKFAITKHKHDGYANSQFDGDKDLFAWRGAFRYFINEQWLADISIDGSKDQPNSSRTPSKETPVFGTPANTDPFVVNANFNDLSKLNVLGSAITVTGPINNTLSFKSISSFRTMDYESHLDLDSTPLSIFGIFVDEKQKQWSQELQLNYNSNNLNSVIGLYIFNEQDVTESGIFGPDIIGLITNSVNDQNNTSYALYGHINYQITDQLSTNFGLRYTHEKKEFKRQQESFSSTDTLPIIMGNGIAVLTDVHESNSWSELSPKLGLEHQIKPNVMIYASVSRGFKSGGFDGRSNSAFQAQPYKPETLTAYEVGIKSQWLQKSLQFNGAVFYNDYKDLQLSSFIADQGGGFASLFTNAGKAVISGLEVEMIIAPSAQFNVNVTAGYMHGEYDEYIGENGQDISNQRELVNTPEWSFRLAPHYRFVLQNLGELTFYIDANYRSKTYSTVSSSEVLAQDGYHLINASISFLSENERWNISLGGKNLEDKRYITQGFDLSDSLGYQLGYYGAPRNYNLTLNYRY